MEVQLKAAGIDMADTNSSVSPGLWQKMQGAGAVASGGLFGPAGWSIDARSHAEPELLAKIKQLEEDKQKLAQALQLTDKELKQALVKTGHHDPLSG